MTHQDIKTALRSFQEQGYAIPALNSKKEVLEKALNELQASIAESEEMPVEDSPVVESEPIEEITPEEPKPIAPPADTLPLSIIPRTAETTLRGWELISLEIKDDLKFVGTVLLYTFSLLKFLVIRATPYVKKFLNFALRVAVYGAVAFRLFVVPKIILLAYYIGIWGVSIALRVVRGRRGVSIA